MSNFNEYFRNYGCKRIVDEFFRGGASGNKQWIDLWSKHKIDRLDYEILPDEGHPASYYLENDLTAVFNVKLTYTVDGGEEKYSTFQVPMEVDGAFIIEGSYRVSTNRLGGDYDCRFSLETGKEQKISFDYNRVYDVSKGILRIKNADYNFGAPQKNYEIKLEKIQDFLNDEEKRAYLKLTERQTKKLQIKLDLDYSPEYITETLINQCIAFGDDRVKDLIIDKKVESVPQCFMNYLFRDGNGKLYYSTRSNIVTYFTKNAAIQEKLDSLSRAFLRFWKGGKGIKNDLQVPPGVNAINLESLRYKIQVPETVAINKSMMDIIDVADTPINNNGNIQNALTVSTHVTDDGVMFDVFDKEFNKITIDYLDYLNKKVVASEYVDYNNNTLKPDENGNVIVKYRMKRISVPVGEIDLIDLHPDFRLSETSRRIPFVNYTDSVRISMGTSMLKQSMVINNAQRPLVDTGHYEELKSNVMNERFEVEGEDSGIVKEITPDFITIKCSKSGELVHINRRTAVRSINDVTMYTEPKVKVGDKVKSGDVIAGPIELAKDTVKVGCNANVLYHAYHGLVNEDAVVISESYADRMASYQLIDLQFDVKNNARVKWIAPIGTKVKSKDAVISLSRLSRLDEVSRNAVNKLGGLLNDGSLQEFETEFSYKVENNIEDAVVADILIQRNNCEEKAAADKKKGKSVKFDYALLSQNYLDEYTNNLPTARKVIYDKYPEYIASDTLKPISLETKGFKVVYTIRVRLIKYSRCVKGEKITNRYGGKGVVSAIIPDDQMPIVNGKRIEVILNPYSTINRKV